MIGLAPLNTLALNAIPLPAMWRGASCMTVCHAEAGQPANADIRIAEGHGQPASAGTVLPMAPGQPVNAGTRIVQQPAARLEVGSQAAIAPGQRHDGTAQAWFRPGQRWRHAARPGFAPGQRRANLAQVLFRPGQRRRALVLLRFAPGQRHQAAILAQIHAGPHWAILLDAWWRVGRRPPYVRPNPTPPIVPIPGLYIGDPHLVFGALTNGDPHLVFRRRRVVRVLPTLEHYTVNNTAYVKRVSDNAPIECKSLTISSDMDSWSLRVTGETFFSERAKLESEAGPVEIEIGINGVAFRALVRRPRGSLKFGGNSASFEGDSPSAVLAAPYAPQRTRINAFDAYAQNIALAELDGTGFALDWQMVDWLIPAGAYSLPQVTPIEGVKRLVEVAGGFLQTHRTTKTLVAAPRYATMPWHWADATPDIVLPLDAFESLGEEWVEKPAYNGVYVAGQHHGVVAWVRRDGTDGATLAPMVAEELLTEQAANEARGAAILADTGAQRHYTVALGVYPEIGVLAPGQLVQVNDSPAWRGLARSFSLSIQWQDGAGLLAYQTVALERHYE